MLNKFDRFTPIHIAVIGSPQFKDIQLQKMHKANKQYRRCANESIESTNSDEGRKKQL